MSALCVDDLSVRFAANGRIFAVREVSLAVAPGECLGVVGESGSGKTQLFMAVMGLLPKGSLATGSILFDGRQMLGAAPRELNQVRGSKLTMIFQDPMTSLTPHLRIGVQLAETLVCHARMSWTAAENVALRMLERVRISEPRRRLQQYPHELSGGMRQRVMIAMSLLCEPALLIADEPTTALDVTVQADIIGILRQMRLESRMATVLISHDLGVVAQLADRMLVMYAGRVVESAATADLLSAAGHPYTAALLECVPNLHAARLPRMPTLPGASPSLMQDDPGCSFAARCSAARARCWVERPLLRDAAQEGHQLACHYPVAM